MDHYDAMGRSNLWDSPFHENDFTKPRSYGSYLRSPQHREVFERIEQSMKARIIAIDSLRVGRGSGSPRVIR